MLQGIAQSSVEAIIRKGLNRGEIIKAGSQQKPSRRSRKRIFYKQYDDAIRAFHQLQTREL